MSQPDWRVRNNSSDPHIRGKAYYQEYRSKEDPNRPAHEARSEMFHKPPHTSDSDPHRKQTLEKMPRRSGAVLSPARLPYHCP